MRTSLLAAIAFVCLGSCQAAPIKFPTVCSAFDRLGDAATAIFSSGRAEILVLPGGGSKPLSFSTKTSNDPDGIFSCEIFFDQESRYVAVGLRPSGLKSGPLDIFVGDLTTKKLIGSFSVHPGATLGESLGLVGFLRDSSSLVVLGSGAPSTRSFSVTRFRVTGELESTPEIRMRPENTGGVGNTSWVDAAHNRLWLKSENFHCPLRSIALAGSKPEGVTIDDSEAGAACDADIAIAYPDEDTIITALTRGNTDPVTEIDLLHHKTQRMDLTLPKGRYTSVDGGTLSPDGKFFAVSRQILSLSFFGDTRSHGIEIDVVQVSPLKLIGNFHLEPTADSQSISIDHRNDAVTMLSFDFKSAKWNSERLQTQ
jgi:hypothetical protein